MYNIVSIQEPKILFCLQENKTFINIICLCRLYMSSLHYIGWIINIVRVEQGLNMKYDTLFY